MKLLTGLVVVGCVCSSALATEPVQRTLTFEDRVRAQEAIERVYYAHQIGATKSFEQALPRAILERKVRNYLDETAALETYWRTAITDATLQRELERMASGTRLPDRLIELYAALNNDPFLVKECLARPALVERLTHNFYSLDPRMHVKERVLAEALHRKLVDGALDPPLDHPDRTVSEFVVGETVGGLLTNEQGSQQVLSREEFLRRRSEFPENVGQVSDVRETRDDFSITVVLSESASRLRVATYRVTKFPWDAWWETARHAVNGDSVVAVAYGGGELLSTERSRSVGRRAPCADGGWDNGVLDDSPDGRVYHTAVWTGREMLVWGGQTFGTLSTNTGNRYDPVTDTWSPMSRTNAPSARKFHTAVWTGRMMVVWGGVPYNNFAPYNTGGRYDPETDTWEAVTTTNAPAARGGHSAVWTGSSMVIWGGTGAAADLSTGGKYDPVADSWTPTSTVGAPSARSAHTAVWTGSLMVVWGGNGYKWTGGRYDLATDTWTPTNDMTAPEGRFGHSAVWTGRFMVVWGGNHRVEVVDPEGDHFYPEPVNTGARYNPATDQWSTTATANAPLPRSEHSAIRTGSEMLVWGGDGPSSGRYDVTTNTWAPMSTAGAPITAGLQSAVWTGELLVVWGGLGSGVPQHAPSSAGGRYDPRTDSWTPTPNGFLGGEKTVWTGNEMIVLWGGRYDPALDVWASIATAGAPQTGIDFTAVWTGSEVLVWGGQIGYYYYTNAGGRYDPLTDTWMPTTTMGAPSPRSRHTAVWTGSQMLVWGGIDDPNGGLFDSLNTGARYDLETDSWLPISPVGAPSVRSAHSAVWTGNAMVVWGGTFRNAYPAPTGYLNTGGRYDPGTDTWVPTSVADAPSARSNHTAVLVGSTMVVWGGRAFLSTASGGRYDPVTDLWLPTSAVGAPPSRSGHAAVSTGATMIVWGGYAGEDRGVPPAVPTGAWYDPVGDRWTKITTTGQPLVGLSTSAVWTGSALIVVTPAHGGRYALESSLDLDCDGDGISASAGDCDDRDVSVYPGAPQVCDGINNDCFDARWPVIPQSGADSEADKDQDGSLVCQGDCDDSKSWIYPGATQLCDGFNNDCNDPLWPNVPSDEADSDRDGVRSCAGDCDDSRDSVRPDFYELCDGFDNNCDGIIDNHAESLCDPPTECSYQVCRGIERCVTINTTSPCDDGNPCTANDACSAGRCFGTPAVGAPCDDRNECTGGEACDSTGRCVGAVLTGHGCDDNNQCTINDQCAPDGRCFAVDLENYSPCDDGSPCTSGDRCFLGDCRGAPRNCNDGNPCNGIDSCDPSSGDCVSSNQAPNCDDGNVCTADSCDPAVGCVHTPAPGPCDDGDACTLGDTCVAGECLWGPVATCDDANPCTDDRCDVETGCLHTAISNACDDGDPCTANDHCGGGACIGTAVVCNDSNVCTTDSCNPATGCAFANNTAACNDGNPCTAIDACSNGVCVGGSSVACAALDQCHVPGVCNPANGICSNPNRPDGTVCNDDNLCTTGDTCHAGTCTPASNGLNHPVPRSSGYYRQLCEKAEHNQVPYHGDQIVDADAVCVASLTPQFSSFQTAADICAVIDDDGARDHQHPGDHDPYSKECFKAEDELIATALNICRARVCEAQNVDSRCGADAHDVTETTVAGSFGDANTIVANPSRTKAMCKQARCELKEINNGHALEMNSVLLAKDAHNVRLSWSAMELEDGSGVPNKYEVWRRPLNSSSKFKKIGETTTALTFLDTTVGTGMWEYEVTADIP